jgi:hypothetical protein
MTATNTRRAVARTPPKCRTGASGLDACPRGKEAPP